MIAIEFECNDCENKDGHVEVILNTTYIVCGKCGEVEEIMGSDITVHCEDVVT